MYNGSSISLYVFIYPLHIYYVNVTYLHLSYMLNYTYKTKSKRTGVEHKNLKKTYQRRKTNVGGNKLFLI